MSVAALVGDSVEHLLAAEPDLFEDKAAGETVAREHRHFCVGLVVALVPPLIELSTVVLSKDDDDTDEKDDEEGPDAFPS